MSRQPSTRQAFFAHDALENAFALQALVLLHRQEDHADAVLAGCGQREAELRAFAREELVRDLDQDAGAVAGFRIAAAGAAMRQVDEDLNALLDDVVAFVAADVGDEADAAGIVLMRRIVKPLRRRETVFRVETASSWTSSERLVSFRGSSFRAHIGWATRCRTSPRGRRRFAVL